MYVTKIDVGKYFKKIHLCINIMRCVYTSTHSPTLPTLLYKTSYRIIHTVIHTTLKEHESELSLLQAHDLLSLPFSLFHMSESLSCGRVHRASAQ